MCPPMRHIITYFSYLLVDIFLHVRFVTLVIHFVCLAFSSQKLYVCVNHIFLFNNYQERRPERFSLFLIICRVFKFLRAPHLLNLPAYTPRIAERTRMHAFSLRFELVIKSLPAP